MNLDSLNAFRERVSRFWRWTLLRRTQKRRLNWAKMHKLIEHWLPKPRVLHRFVGCDTAVFYDAKVAVSRGRDISCLMPPAQTI
jgi:hypothetical protein